MRVVVAGGGIGGLALAQGLLRRGYAVTVVEPDVDLARTGGYKLHLGPTALAALETLLPGERHELLLGSSMGSEDFRIAVRDHRGRLLVRASDDQGPGTSVEIDRVTLRLVLAEGLGSALRTGLRVVGHRTVRQLVEVDLDDGTSLEADLLVLADGAGSELAAALAGSPTSTPTGLVGVAGRTPWASLPEGAQALVREDPMLAVGPAGAGLFASLHDPRGRPAHVGVRSLARTTEPVVIWGFLGTEGLLPERLKEVPPSDLVDRVTQVLGERSWADATLDLLTWSDRRTVGGFRFLAADPAGIAPWSAGPVTAIGDAVHAMPPTGGQGAATAVRDAAALVEELGRAGASTGVVGAVAAYERRMREYAARAVNDSLEPVSWIRRSATPSGRLVLRLALPVAAGAAALARGLRRSG